MVKPQNPTLIWQGAHSSGSEITLRDIFAGQALQGLLTGASGQFADFFTEQAYRIADAMLEQRGK